MLTRSRVRSCTELGRRAARPPRASHATTESAGITAWNVGSVSDASSLSLLRTTTMKSASSNVASTLGFTLAGSATDVIARA